MRFPLRVLALPTDLLCCTESERFPLAHPVLDYELRHFSLWLQSRSNRLVAFFRRVLYRMSYATVEGTYLDFAAQPTSSHGLKNPVPVRTPTGLRPVVRVMFVFYGVTLAFRTLSQMRSQTRMVVQKGVEPLTFRVSTGRSCQKN